MRHTEEYNSVETVAWLLLAVCIIALAIVTVDLIRDRNKQRRRATTEQRQLETYEATQREADTQLFRTVQEAQDDFR